MQVNGQVVTYELDPQRSLLSLLRDELCLSGPKFGCGQGECGACMVIVDGKAQTSCNLPIWAVQDSQITTVEGLGSPEAPHPIQTAFLEQRAAQCGFCVSGIMTSAAALLAHQPNPSHQDIVEALDKHLCRCCAHVRMIRAVGQAAHQMTSIAIQD